MLADVRSKTPNSGRLWTKPPQVRGRSRFLGVETWAELVWESWELGREFTKTLTLKNVHCKLQKLHFRPPASRAFTTLSPQTITLSPGTSFGLPVTFRPLDLCEHHDSIEFQSRQGSFTVSLRASVPQHALQLPEEVSLPICAVQGTTQTSFTFRNASTMETGFHWEVGAPFRLSPESGVLEPGAESRVNVSFRPQEARPYQEEASCVFGDGGTNRCAVLLRGISKYPHLQINAAPTDQGSSLLPFDEVPVGGTKEKFFHLQNVSSVFKTLLFIRRKSDIVTLFDLWFGVVLCQVSASFRLSWLRRPALMERVFGCELREGLVSPGSSVRVPVSFAPVAVDTCSVDYLSLSCPGAPGRRLLKLTGSGCGPAVSLGASVVDFGRVDEGQGAERSVRLTNSGTAEAHYQFDVGTDGHSVFVLDRPCGTVPAHGSTALRLHFRPRHPVTHHRRVACVLLHQDPLFLDLIGTCHSEHLKPAALAPRHLRVYQLHLRRGLTCYPPNILGAMLAKNKLRRDEDGALALPEGFDEDSAAADMSRMEEYFQQMAGEDVPSSTRCHVTAAPSELLFYQGPASQSVTVTNHTKGRVCLLWTSEPKSPFSVSPSSGELGPLKTTAFRVTYCPPEANGFHAAQLECFALYTILRDHRQTGDSVLSPPWCVTVRVSGHSFQPGREHFVPRYRLLQPHVVFPAVPLVSYRTVLLQNTGDLPLLFRLDPQQCPLVTVLPASGLVLPGSHQVLTLRSTPSETRSSSLTLTLTLQLNGSTKHTQDLTVVSVAERPRVCVEGDGCVVFKPTGVGSSSRRCIGLRNMSRFPLNFHWRVCGPDKNVLSVEPSSGTLHPNDTMVQTWVFCPGEEMEYNMKPRLSFWPAQSPDWKRSRLSLKAVGVASKGSIQTDTSTVHLGVLLVGSCKSFEIPVLNKDACSVSFSLTVEQSLMDPDLPRKGDQEPLVLDLDPSSGTIPAQSCMMVRGTVKPAGRADYCWTVRYQILSSSGSAPGEWQVLCQVRGQGVFPTLEVTDARSGGSVERLSKMTLWSLFSLDALNAHLRQDPAPCELTNGVPPRFRLRRCPSAFTSAILDFNFSAAPLGSGPSFVFLMFQNTGSLPVESFLFPEDQEIELEYWAESGEFTSTELHQLKMQDQQLFSVSPGSGRLQPDQQRAVQLTYRHDFTGTHRLPVQLKLSHGREILLNFEGVTVDRDMLYLHYASSSHTFAPVPIGGFNPPKQVYELYNGGALPLTYHVDTGPLEQLTAENFGHPVLTCLNPHGEVEPGHAALMEWLFSPLEAKTYSVDVPISVLEGDTMLVRFEGCGMDIRDQERPVPIQPGPISMPCTQRVPLPGQVVFLSEDRVCLGDIPVCSCSTRILFITNVSMADRVLFTWTVADEAVRIVPERGCLAAGQSALLVLSLCASGRPSFYQLDLICEVTLAAALARHHSALLRWEEEQERRQEEFTITDLSATPTPLAHHRPQSAVVSEHKAGAIFRTYKTLPPIRSSSRAERRARSRRGGARVWMRPEAPRPMLLHLGLTARSHSLLEFQASFPSQVNKHTVLRSLQSGTEAADVPTATLFKDLPPHVPERDIITDTITSIIRSLLEDPQFQQTLLQEDNEPVPFFIQLGPPHAPPSHSPQPVIPGTSPAGLEMSQSGAPCRTTGTGVKPEIPECRDVHKAAVQENIRRLPELGELVEDILLNTLQNLMTEAFLGEMVLTAQPRIITLPPSRSRRSLSGRSSSQPEAERGRESPEDEK
ncbi:cilia- and flagella-associated protein 65 isoform X2 [Denticeps clupeoides]|uniref:cilia- and flagella-associated protein 65 isoform X2 n=1 Tax=Denticeps clupeoides TaxID=299321 RepID=UPI0010A55288|nr:cilia- and flagella-associated protein 65 isoform X2 [Denticeps clupeoides]